MKFSIIIPVYNAEKYLENTLIHTLHYAGEDFELILVDDGSQDDSPQICDRYAEQFPDIVKVIHQKNQGQLVARCNGIHAAQGDYCLFLDADDALNENCLHEAEVILEKYGNPDVVICSFLYENPDGTTRAAKKICDGERFFQDKTELYKLFFSSTLLNNIWTKMIKREVLLRCEIEIERYKKLRCAEDRLHSMEIITKADSIVYTDHIWYRYRLVADSVTRTFNPACISKFDDSILYDITGEYLKKWQLTSPEWTERMNAEWINHTVYVFDLFYSHCKDKKAVLSYDWSSFLPAEVFQNYRSNTIINETKKKYLTWILEKEKRRIDFYIWKRNTKKKIVKQVRATKRKLVG